MKKILLLGATGETGKLLLQLLAKESGFFVKIYTRKPIPAPFPHSEVFVGELKDLANHPHIFEGIETVICTLGSTSAKTPNQKDYYGIDVDAPVIAAQMAKNAGATQFLYISSIGADAKALAPYSKMKGIAEEKINAVGIPNTLFLRPSLIDSQRTEKRFAEHLLIKMMRLANPFLGGGLKKYRSIKIDRIASRIMFFLQGKGQQNGVLESDAI